MVLVVLLNGLAAFHAYRFSHFGTSTTTQVKQPEEYSWPERLWLLVAGAPQGRKPITTQATGDFLALNIASNEQLSAWYLPADEPVGDVALFHGYRSNKLALLQRAEWFRRLGYNCLLVDFTAAGDSEGEWCTIGYHEAAQVADAVLVLDSLSSTPDRPTILFGNSMGAAAVMRYASLHPSSKHQLILECPFNTLLKTTQNRFASMGAPAFPAAHLLVFWGGFINEFNGFRHNPATYATSITAPALYISGEEDERVFPSDLAEIVEAHAGLKQQWMVPSAGHEDYWPIDSLGWQRAVQQFLEQSHDQQ